MELDSVDAWSFFAINNSGTVVGSANVRAAAWNGSSTPIDLGTLGGTSSSANAINNSGLIVGHSDLPNYYNPSVFHAVVYNGGVVTDLGAFGGVLSAAMGINDAGTIVGNTWWDTDQDLHSTRAFEYANGVYKELGNLGGDSRALAINSSGVIVGDSQIGSGPAGYSHAFRYSNDSMQDLGVLLGDSGSDAQDINDSGLIVGNSYAMDSTRAFTYENGVMTPIGTFGSFTYATGVNNLGMIVGGASFEGHPEPSAFAYYNGTMLDLNAYLVTDTPWLVQGRAINDVGQIVATTSAGRSFLLTPVDDDPFPGAVPEIPDTGPTLGLLTLGVLGLALVGSRRLT